MQTPDGEPPQAQPGALSKRQIIVWSVIFGAVLLVVLSRSAFEPKTNSRPAAPAAQVPAGARPASTSAKPPASTTANAALPAREEIATWTAAQREARMREACRDDGHCNPALVYELLKASSGAETARLEKVCLEARNGAVRRARALLGQLRKLARNGGGADAVGSVDDVRAELNKMAADFTGIVNLRIAAGNVRACVMLGEGSHCDDAAALLRDAEKELQEPQRAYCALK
ncbi:hypothetical protein WMF31_09350 [Sorangium sp. So ce1036]|uniref:hypothetical protein n=1 Tax=Sorangium sp. So ce1036 TaxID=3133328 RepID=UPI003F0A15FC